MGTTIIKMVAPFFLNFLKKFGKIKEKKIDGKKILVAIILLKGMK